MTKKNKILQSLGHSNGHKPSEDDDDESKRQCNEIQQNNNNNNNNRGQRSFSLLFSKQKSEVGVARFELTILAPRRYAIPDGRCHRESVRHLFS